MRNFIGSFFEKLVEERRGTEHDVGSVINFAADRLYSQSFFRNFPCDIRCMVLIFLSFNVDIGFDFFDDRYSVWRIVQNDIIHVLNGCDRFYSQRFSKIGASWAFIDKTIRGY